MIDATIEIAVRWPADREMPLEDVVLNANLLSLNTTATSIGAEASLLPAAEHDRARWAC